MAERQITDARNLIAEVTALGAAMRADLLNTPVPPLAQAEAMPFPTLSWADAKIEQRLNVAPAPDKTSLIRSLRYVSKSRLRPG